MIVGSGLLGTAFSDLFSARNDVLIYAAGVSNSWCEDAREYQRDADRLACALSDYRDVAAFVYFGTCSVLDPAASDSVYVHHKLVMEGLVRQHKGHIIVRLPQVAGHTPNPHTLLNFLYARISRGERFPLYRQASRNIIDVDDVVALTSGLIDNISSRRLTLNIANHENMLVGDIVGCFDVSAGVILTHPVGVNLTHLGNDGGFLATDNVDSGASSGDQGNGASRRQHSGDGQAARLLTQHGQAIPA